MTQAEAKRAVQEACADNLKKVFGILTANLLAESPDGAGQKFKAECTLYLRAYKIAMAAVEDVFKD